MRSILSDFRRNLHSTEIEEVCTMCRWMESTFLDIICKVGKKVITSWYKGSCSNLAPSTKEANYSKELCLCPLVYMHESWRESGSVRKKVKDCESRHTVGRGTEGGCKFRIASVPAQVYVCIKSSPQIHRHSGDPTSCVCISVSFLKVINLWQEDMGRQKEYLDKLSRFFQIRNLLLRQALAECLGTLILVVSACLCVEA